MLRFTAARYDSPQFACHIDDRDSPRFLRETDCLFPGRSLAATQDGRITLERGYDMADLEQGVAIRPETLCGR